MLEFSEKEKGEDYVWEIKLAWSIFKNGKWIPKKKSKDFAETKTNKEELFKNSKIFLLSHFSGNTLTISLRMMISNSISNYFGSFLFYSNGEVEFILPSEWMVAVPIKENRPISATHNSNKFLEFSDRDGLILNTPEGEIDLLRKTPGNFKITFQSRALQIFDSNYFYKVPFFYSEEKLPDSKLFVVAPREIKQSVVVPGDSGVFGGDFPVNVGLNSPNEASIEVVGRLMPEFFELESSSIISNPSNRFNNGNSISLDASTTRSSNDITPLSGYTRIRKYHFYNFYHPYIDSFISKIVSKGAGELFGNLELQEQSNKSFFKSRYGDPDIPNSVIKDYPHEKVSFSLNNSYGLYNWELFFHIPLLIANRLSQEQKFSEAQEWLHLIFNPTSCTGEIIPQCYWKVLPFYRNSLKTGENKPIQELIRLITKGNPNAVISYRIWLENPFDPHAIAEHRKVAYQKNVVMKYLDNLIAWGDQLFRQDSIESINEATQLYLLALEILGPRPSNLINPHEINALTYSELEKEGLDLMSNSLLELEEHLSNSFSTLEIYEDSINSSEGESLPNNLGSTLYFCVPKNEKLLSYWDLVDDRLFKIRNCMNIEGLTRKLALFEPPIDPALLIRAFASGVDIRSAISQLNAPLPFYRFQYYLGKAFEMANEVKQIGGQLLAALEKKDAEKLTLLNSSQQVRVFEALDHVKKLQEEESAENKESLEKAKMVAEKRFKYYSEIERHNDLESSISNLGYEVISINALSSMLFLAASIVTPSVPEFYLLSGVPVKQKVTGGEKVGKGLELGGIVSELLSKIINQLVENMKYQNDLDRRNEEYDHQAELAKLEMDQLDKQIEVSEIQKNIAIEERKNNRLQLQNLKEVEEVMRSKFTNEELYQWVIDQVSKIFFKSYQLVYDLAKKAEKAYQFEIADDNSNFIQFGYWDSLKKGLLSGDKLFFDLKRMESAYMERNKREFEITQSFSLMQLNPFALIKLKNEGSGLFDIPEMAFDLVYPGHYFRRIKSVSITIPCVTGPYVNVGARLTLGQNRFRINCQTSDYTYLGINDPNYRHNLVGSHSIATSNGLSDSGLFELNFRDERYLPFEGAGVVSSWQLDLPTDFRPFDYNSISDVILHISYTARDGGDRFKGIVNKSLKSRINIWLDELSSSNTGLPRLLDLKHEFSGSIHHFKNSADNGMLSTELNLTRRHFPSWLSNGSDLKQIEFVTDQIEIFVQDSSTVIPQPDMTFARNQDFETEVPFGRYTLKGNLSNIEKDNIKNIFILLKYIMI